MPKRVVFATSMILVLMLGACAAPETPPATDVPMPTAPVATVSPIEATATPLPIPTPTPAVETEPPSATGQEAVVAAVRDTAATALGVDPEAVEIVSIEAVQWPDSCLGVTLTDQACAEVITPGYRVVVEVDGARYAVHTNEDGSTARFAEPVEPPAGALPGDLGMAWRSSSEPCDSAVITADSIAFGTCGGPLKQAPLGSQELADDLAYYTSVYAPFEAQTLAGWLGFNGSGLAVATPAEQRMMAEWARLVAQQAEQGRSDAAWGLAMVWHREGGIAGFCDDLAVYVAGHGWPSTCQTDPATTLDKRWLTAGQAGQLFGWIDALASFSFERRDPAVADAMAETLAFTGSGVTPASEVDQQAMLSLAAWLTTYGAQATEVRYVSALVDLPVTSGPGSQFAPVGEVFAGQTAFVTGVSPDQQWWRVICADGTIDNCWVSADPMVSQPAEPSGQAPSPSSAAPATPWDPPAIYATVIRQLVTVDHTFGQPPELPTVYLVRQTSGNAAIPGGSASASETIFPGDQQRILALLDDLASEFVWVDRMEDVPRTENELVAGDAAIIQVGSIVPQADGSLHVPGSIYFGPLAAGGQTYVLQVVDGVWQITGKAGPAWMS